MTSLCLAKAFFPSNTDATFKLGLCSTKLNSKGGIFIILLCPKLRVRYIHSVEHLPISAGKVFNSGTFCPTNKNYLTPAFHWVHKYPFILKIEKFTKKSDYRALFNKTYPFQQCEIAANANYVRLRFFRVK